MARGWESKSIEEQIEKKADAHTEKRPALSAEEKERLRKKTELELMLAKLRSDLKISRSLQYAQMLKAAIRDIEAQLQKLCQ